MYETTAQADALGKALHSLRYRNRTVGDVLAMLKKRKFSVAEYRYDGRKGRASQPRNWNVHDADVWAPGQVLLWVGRKPAR